MANIQLTQKLVQSLFDYKNGFLIRKSNNYTLGSKSRRMSPEFAYLSVRVNGICEQVHRIIFLWHKGWLPEKVDHGDRDTRNNKIENLRAATTKQNGANRIAKINSTSEYLGVSKRRSRPNAKNNWFCCIENNGTQYLGVFETEAKAALAYNKAAIKVHGEFANLNIIKP